MLVSIISILCICKFLFRSVVCHFLNKLFYFRKYSVFLFYIVRRYIYAPFVKIACTVCRPLIIRNVFERVYPVAVSLI